MEKEGTRKLRGGKSGSNEGQVCFSCLSPYPIGIGVTGSGFFLIAIPISSQLGRLNCKHGLLRNHQEKLAMKRKNMAAVDM